MRAFLEHIAVSIRRAVRPWVVGLRGRGVVGTAATGDATFEVDRRAEHRLEALLRASGRCLLYYSEDRGLVAIGSGEPEAVFIVDPIDGTRNARSGLEGCMVSVAAIVGSPRERINQLTLGDVTHACLAEIVGQRVFYAQRDGGAEWRQGGRTYRPRPSAETDLDRIAWTLDIVGRPARQVFEVMGDLVDRSSVTGNFFTGNSICFSLTRLVTGQLDAALDIANRICRDRPETRAAFLSAGRGAVIGLCPHDLAAAVLVAREAGCAVTDAYGEPLDSTPALGGAESLRSLIAAGNPILHARLLAYVNERLGVQT
jgi:myo-inositol-1(or 4)-monophosphatase